MCRFLVVKSKSEAVSKDLLLEFAKMCEKSRTPEGDRQSDGWGISWKNDQGKWEVYKSLKPVWEDIAKIKLIAPSLVYLVHARSAYHLTQKGILEYNQPYIEGELSFVFNGMIRGVSFPIKLSGTIGAQKIFALVLSHIHEKNTDFVLPLIRDVIRENARRVEGMNIGLSFGDRLYALCDYENNADYFSLRYFEDEKIVIICSEKMGSYRWQVMKKGETLTL